MATTEQILVALDAAMEDSAVQATAGYRALHAARTHIVELNALIVEEQLARHAAGTEVAQLRAWAFRVSRELDIPEGDQLALRRAAIVLHPPFGHVVGTPRCKPLAFIVDDVDA